MSARPLRIVVTACVTTAILALWMLPPEHLHDSHDGPAVVHRHLIDHEAAQTGLALEHDAHHEATVLEPTYDAVRAFAVERPAVVVAAVLPTPLQGLTLSHSPSAPPIAHSPPLRIPSLRAPPA